MNRRFFLRTLAIVTGSVFIPARAAEITPPIPPVTQFGKQFVINPEWRDAPYEIAFYAQGSSFWPETAPTNAPAGMHQLRDPFPRRFRNPESAQAWLDRFAALNEKRI
jgi:hypothetical protein